MIRMKMKSFAASSLCVFFFLVGCRNAGPSNSQNGIPKDFAVKLQVVPEFWRPGDSVNIILIPICGVEDAILSQPEFSVRSFLGQPQTIEYGIRSKTLLIPQFDPKNWTQGGKPDAEVIGIFTFPEKKIAVFLKERYFIRANGRGQYRFEKDSLFFELDTVPRF